MHSAISNLLHLTCVVFFVLFVMIGLSRPCHAETSTTEAPEIHGEQVRKKTSVPTTSLGHHAQALVRQARAALRKGDRQSALGVLASIPELDGAAHLAAGNMLIEEKAYADAASEFGLARRSYRDRYTPGYDQALAYEYAGDYTSAIQTANELLDQGAQTAELADVAAMAYLKTGKKTEAYNAYRLATHLDPKDEDAYLGLCEIALDRDDYDLGTQVANIGLSYLPKSERLFVERGVMHAMKGESAAAERDFLTATKIAPRDALPVVSTALVSIQNGNLARAIELLRQTAKQHPDNYFAQYWFAEGLLRAGVMPGSPEDDEVLHALQNSVRDNPDFWHSRAELGKALLERGDLDGALQQLKRAAELNPKATSPLYLLAQAYRKKGDEAEAAELLTRVNAMQAEEREAQTIPEAVLKDLVKRGTASPSIR